MCKHLHIRLEDCGRASGALVSRHSPKCFNAPVFIMFSFDADTYLYQPFSELSGPDFRNLCLSANIACCLPFPEQCLRGGSSPVLSFMVAPGQMEEDRKNSQNGTDRTANGLSSPVLSGPQGLHVSS